MFPAGAGNNSKKVLINNFMSIIDDLTAKATDAVGMVGGMGGSLVDAVLDKTTLDEKVMAQFDAVMGEGEFSKLKDMLKDGNVSHDEKLAMLDMAEKKGVPAMAIEMIKKFI